MRIFFHFVFVLGGGVPPSNAYLFAVTVTVACVCFFLGQATLLCLANLKRKCKPNTVLQSVALQA